MNQVKGNSCTFLHSFLIFLVFYRCVVFCVWKVGKRVDLQLFSLFFRFSTFYRPAPYKTNARLRKRFFIYKICLTKARIGDSPRNRRRGALGDGDLGPEAVLAGDVRHGDDLAALLVRVLVRALHVDRLVLRADVLQLALLVVGDAVAGLVPVLVAFDADVVVVVTEDGGVLLRGGQARGHQS